jgi:hypothetical protein
MSERLPAIRPFVAGDVIFVECDEHVSDDARAVLQESLDRIYVEMGVRAVVLERGMRLVGKPEGHT